MTQRDEHMQRDAHRHSVHRDDEAVTYTKTHSLGTTLTKQQHASRHDMQRYTGRELSTHRPTVTVWNDLRSNVEQLDPEEMMLLAMMLLM